MGNICRSPAGEAVMKRFAEEFRVPVDVDSAVSMPITSEKSRFADASRCGVPRVRTDQYRQKGDA